MPASSPRPIALVGMMGSGKTSVGRELAARLGWPFADSDDEVEQAAGLCVRDLFARDGEAAFRQRERKAIAALLDRAPLVLATGGGAMADAGTRALLLERALTVWLKAPVELLAQRLSGTTDRPLLNNPDPLATLRRLAGEREADYAHAHLCLATDGLSPSEVAAKLAGLIGATGSPD